jgi:hypothetical protein
MSPGRLTVAGVTALVPLLTALAGSWFVDSGEFVKEGIRAQEQSAILTTGRVTRAVISPGGRCSHAGGDGSRQSSTFVADDYRQCDCGSFPGVISADAFPGTATISIT